MHIRPLVLPQADHATLPATKAGSNKHRNLDRVGVLQTSLGEPVLRNPIDSRGTDNVGLNVTYGQLSKTFVLISASYFNSPPSAEATATSTSLKGCVIASDWMSSTDASL